MNHAGFKQYLQSLGVYVEGLADAIQDPGFSIDVDGVKSYDVLGPIIKDLREGNRPGYLGDFYVWLHTAAREMTADAKAVIETIDEKSPHPNDMGLILALSEQARKLDSLVTEYGKNLARDKPWINMTGNTMDCYRFWQDRSGKEYGEPEARKMEAKKLPVQRVSIVVMEEDNGAVSAGVSCNDGYFKKDDSVGAEVAPVFVFDMPSMMTDYLMKGRGLRGPGSASDTREARVIQCMQTAVPLMRGLVKMADVMRERDVLVDPDCLFGNVEIQTQPKGVLAEESPDAKIEIGSWS